MAEFLYSLNAPRYLADYCVPISDVPGRGWLILGMHCALCTRDESILGIPTGPVGPMGMGIAKLISWEWEWKWELLDGNGGNENSTFSHFQSE